MSTRSHPSKAGVVQMVRQVGERALRNNGRSSSIRRSRRLADEILNERGWPMFPGRNYRNLHLMLSGHSSQSPAEADSPFSFEATFLLKKENVSNGAGYPDDESTDELDPNRVCVPNLVVKENTKQNTERDNQRPSEFHEVTIHSASCSHKSRCRSFTVDAIRRGC